jgi:hypothetical protein
MLRTVNVTRYIQPLREGGSLPALAEADDDFKYVLKFRGNGHGPKVLIAELIGGEIARELGLRVPELVFAHLDEAFGRTEGDEEVQDLLKGSQGLNIALHFLSGSITFDPVVSQIDPETASKIVWLDSFIANIDRTVKNTNMLMFNKELWLIDHGSSLSFHHAWMHIDDRAKSPFPFVKEHVLLSQAALLDETNTAFKILLTTEKIRTIVNLIPDAWLAWPDTDQSPDELKEVYYQFLVTRLQHADIFTQQAQDARAALI